jgi:hypothetical protein
MFLQKSIMSNRFDDMLSLWQQILEIEVLYQRESCFITKYKKLRRMLNEETKRKTESELPTWLIKARKKQSKVWNKLTKEGYGKL